MLVWFAVMSVVVTWTVFQSPAIDYRLVALGAVLPLVEVPWGAAVLHSLLAPTAVLVVIMLATVHRRLVRRRWLGLPIGMYLHLVLDGAWARTETFWWPFLGTELSPGVAPELDRGLWTVLMELVAVCFGLWAFRRFGLADPTRRRLFLTTGQLDRAHLSPPRAAPGAGAADRGGEQQR